MLGVTVGNILNKKLVNLKSLCFQEVIVTHSWLSNDTLVLNWESNNKTTFTCSETYIITSLINFDLRTLIFPGKSSITYKMKNQDEIDLVKSQGLKILKMCDEWYRIMPDVLTSLLEFIPGNLPVKFPYANFIKKIFQKQQLDIQKNFLDEKNIKRNPKHKLTPDFLRKHVRSGDVLTCKCLELESSLIIISNGGPVDHSAIAMWKDDVLWVVQANEVMEKISPEGFFEFCVDSFVWLPLSEEHRAKFDVNKTWSWFDNGIENLPYGLQNAFFLWLNTPNSNYPLVTDVNYWTFLWVLVDKAIPAVSKIFMGNALNNRLGTKDLNLVQIIIEANKRGKTIGDIFAMPELDSYRYDGQQAFVCSA